MRPGRNTPPVQQSGSAFVIRGWLWPDPSSAPFPGWILIEIDASTRRGRIRDLAPIRERAAPPDTPVAINGLSEIAPLLIAPGFIDAHAHVPQINSIGYDGLELLEWLGSFIFPAESRWADSAVAQADAGWFLSRIIEAGTLGAAAYLTSHGTGAKAVADTAASMAGGGPRLAVGRVLMDRESPASLHHKRADVDRALRHRDFSRWCGTAQDNVRSNENAQSCRIEWSVNPRFAIACTGEALEHAAALAKLPPEHQSETGTAGGDPSSVASLSPSPRIVQTHLAETPTECRRVAELFPESNDYLAVYEQYGLVHERSLLALAIHLSDDAWQRIAAAGAVVVHCPTANLFLEAGSFDLAAATRHKARVALGSDIAAGPDAAMPRVARAMIENAKWRRMRERERERADQQNVGAAIVPTPAQAWSMITRGNADALGWTDAGRLEVGAAADLLLLQPGRCGIDIAEPHLAGRLIYNWRNDLIRARVINGVIDDADREAGEARPSASREFA
ncbi:MAG: amidohydrolase family protein [Planctomycetota bacterium]